MPDISDGMLDLMAYKFKKYLGSVSREIQNRRMKMDDAYVVKKNENLFAKDEVIQMLTDIQLRIEEMAHYESADGQDLVMLADIGELFQEKINALRGDTDDM